MRPHIARKGNRARRSLVAWCFLASVSCARQSSCVGDHLQMGDVREIAQTWGGPGNVDVLFVIDINATMVAHQARLAAAMETFALSLEAYAQGLPSLRIGVMTSDLGVANHVANCDIPGDDAQLVGDCDLTDDALYLHVQAQADGSVLTNAPDAWPATAACLLAPRTARCEVPRPWEAFVRAMDGRLADFIRSDARLLVAFVGNTDDCSMLNPGESEPSSSDGWPMWCLEKGVVCQPDLARDAYAQGTTPLSACAPRSGPTRQIDEILGTLFRQKATRADLAVAVIGGPTNAVVVERQADAVALTSVCAPPLVAGPAVRQGALLDAAARRGLTTMELSICEAMDGQLSALGGAIEHWLDRRCLAAGLVDELPDQEGHQVACTIVEQRANAPGSYLEADLFECADTTTRPCYSYVPDPTCADESGLRLAVDYGSRERLPTDRIVARCLQRAP